MNKTVQIKKAEQFLKQHHDRKLLILPNVWDLLGAKMLERMGYPSIATASASIAFSNGYQDGEHLRFDQMLATVRKISNGVSIPVTMDFESGYASDLKTLKSNIKEVIEAGVVGVNIEDKIPQDDDLLSIEEQCERIRTIRTVADDMGVPLVINARTDLYLHNSILSDEQKSSETIKRGKAYISAGANCFYPILLNNQIALSEIVQEVAAPINVLANTSLPSMDQLEKDGIARISLGPSLLKVALTAMKHTASELLGYKGYDTFGDNVISYDEIEEVIS